jgi:hypothetical protein
MLVDYQDSIFSAGVMAGSVIGFLLIPIALTWLLEGLARFVSRHTSQRLFGFVLIPLWLTATHIEVEWATILLNFRQAVTMSVVALPLALVLRLLHNAMVIATRVPVSGSSVADSA